MQTKLNKYWIIIALIIIVNVSIFLFFSSHLESFVADYTASVDTRSGL
ncbi:MAG: hypothetical protein AAB477_02090 [Patescibacteria group bacterium]